MKENMIAKGKLIMYIGLALIGWSACSDEIAPGFLSDSGELRLCGYNAQSVQISTRAEDVIKGFFLENTHYRLWMYDVNDDSKEETARWNESVVGWDKESGSEHYIQLPENAELNFNDKGEAVKFYGLTDPAIQEPHNSAENHEIFDSEYLKPDEANPTQYTVKLAEGTLPDLRATASKPYKKGDAYVIQLPFKHILSKVNFEIVQQIDDAGNEKYSDLTLEGIEVLNQPVSGTFDVKQSKFISFNEKKQVYEVQGKSTSSDTPGTPTGITGVAIETQPKEVGSILLFPMTAESITENNMLKVQVTLGSKDKKLLEPFAKEESSITGDEGSYRLALECPIYSTTSTDETGKQKPLKLEPNYEYDIQFVIMSNEVRIITIVPRVYEWLDGETDKKDEDGNGYEEQDMGQPVTFGGVVWNDRNLGANSAHPLSGVNEWRKSVGYFYQFNRNIPYFPNNYENKDVNLNTPLDVALHEDASEGEKGFRVLYPVVNYKAWDLDYVRPNENWYPPQESGDRQAIKPIGGKPHDNFVYTLGGKAKPFDDKTSGGDIIRFGINYSNNGKQGRDENNEEITERKFPGQRYLWRKKDGTKGDQPCPKGWSIPTEEQFKSIIPTSGYAGNITFRNYVAEKGQDDGGWDAGTEVGKKSEYTEHDFPSLFGENGNGLIYKESLSESGVGEPMPGNKAYLGSFPCLFREEKNDPKEGAKSQYVLSMYGDDWTRVQDASGNLNEVGKGKNEDYVYNWGVIYGIKNQGTPKAYRIKWEVKVVGTPQEVNDLSKAKAFCDNKDTDMYKGKTAQRYKNLYCYLVISRYPATATDNLLPDEKGSCVWVAQKKEWWSNPAEVMYLPISGVAGFFRYGKLYNIGTEVRYGLVDESEKEYKERGQVIKGEGTPYKRCVWLKIAGSSTASLGLFFADSYTSDLISIRPVRD